MMSVTVYGTHVEFKYSSSPDSFGVLCVRGGIVDRGLITIMDEGIPAATTCNGKRFIRFAHLFPQDCKAFLNGSVKVKRLLTN